MITPEAIEAAFAREGERVERIETHVSWVFLGRSRVLKLKKPVALGFLDFSTRAARDEACAEELRINARFAPDVYRGLATIVERADGSLAFDGEGDVVEHGVWMTRLPDAERADVLLAEDRLRRSDVERIAERIATLHAESRHGAELDEIATPEAIAKNVRDNFATIRERLGDLMTPDEARTLEAWQLGVLVEARGRFLARRLGGFIRDGHGDLRLEHVYLRSDAVRILDAIEFACAYRVGDVASDVAFLSMDLASHGHVELAERFLARYARATNDFDLYGVVDFYESYRACVRGKIALLRARDPNASPSERSSAEATARRMLLFALSCGKRSALRPTLVAVGGLIAAGKSTIADALGDAMSAPVVDADRTRKNMLAVAATTPLHHGAWDGAYALEFTEHVYGEMLRRAEVVLASGRPVVVEASFRSRAMRARVRDLARAYGVPFHLVECVVPPAVCRARLEERARTASVSDGRLAIFDDFVKSFEAIDELPPSEHVAVDATAPIETTIARLGERLPLWPAGLAG